MGGGVDVVTWLTLLGSSQLSRCEPIGIDVEGLSNQIVVGGVKRRDVGSGARRELSLCL